MPLITREYYEANKEKIDRNYLIQRVERWKTSGCAIHWDYCPTPGPFGSQGPCPVQLEQDEIDLLMMGAIQDRLS